MKSLRKTKIVGTIGPASENKLKELFKTQTIVKKYLKERKEQPRELILKIVDKIEIHQDKTVDLYFKLKQLE